jgi:hypothetical protein
MDKIDLYKVLEKYIEKHPEVEEFDKPEVQMYGNLIYNVETDTAIFKNQTSTFPIESEDLEKLHYMLVKDHAEVQTISEYVQSIKRYVEEKFEELKNETGYDFKYVTPETDQFEDWFLDWSEICPIKKCGDRWNYYPTGWAMKFAEEVREAFFNEMGYDRYGHGRYNSGDDAFIEMLGARSIFYVPFDEFSRSPHKTLADRYMSELQNDVLGDRIPSSGKSRDMAAELVTNLNYALYRWYNDGDVAENLINEPNAIVMVNVLQYIDDMNTYNSMIFGAFYTRAMRMITCVNSFQVDKFKNLDELAEYAVSKDNGSRNYFHSNLSEEVENKIFSGEFKPEDTKNMYDYENKFRPMDYVEFMINEAVPLLIAIIQILKVYPNYLKDEEVKDLRGRYFKLRGSSRYDW